MTQKKHIKGFYKIPKLIFSPECELSPMAAIIYTVIADRYAASKHNNMKDEEGKVFCIMPTAQVAEILKCGEKKAMSVMAELEKYGYIKRVRQGLTRPHRTYLLKEYDISVPAKVHLRKSQVEIYTGDLDRLMRLLDEEE